LLTKIDYTWTHTDTRPIATDYIIIRRSVAGGR